jgi:hypothetical protein
VVRIFKLKFEVPPCRKPFGGNLLQKTSQQNLQSKVQSTNLRNSTKPRRNLMELWQIFLRRRKRKAASRRRKSLRRGARRKMRLRVPTTSRDPSQPTCSITITGDPYSKVSTHVRPLC